MYSRQVLDHFEHPRRGGKLEPYDGASRMENPACGDVLEITVAVEGGRIRDARFRAQGCVPTMACGSLAAEWLVGKSVDEGRALSKEQVIEALGGLPPASHHAGQLAVDAVRAALAGL